MDTLVEAAWKKQTGARGISGALLRVIEEAAYDRFGSGVTGALHVHPGDPPTVTFEPGPAPPVPKATGTEPSKRRRPYPNVDAPPEVEQAIFEIQMHRRPPKP